MLFVRVAISVLPAEMRSKRLFLCFIDTVKLRLGAITADRLGLRIRYVETLRQRSLARHTDESRRSAFVAEIPFNPWPLFFPQQRRRCRQAKERTRRRQCRLFSIVTTISDASAIRLGLRLAPLSSIPVAPATGHERILQGRRSNARQPRIGEVLTVMMKTREIGLVTLQGWNEPVGLLRSPSGFSEVTHAARKQ